jgi:4-hydroxy-L-threonine phosphate dehydrogenase PdxA
MATGSNIPSVEEAVEQRRPLVGITMGDPGGVGADAVVRALVDADLRHQGRFIIYGLHETISYAADQAEIVPFWFRRPHESVDRVESGVVVADFDEYGLSPSRVPHPTRQGGEASMRFLDEAIIAARAGLLDVLFTGPTSPESWRLAGIRFRSILDKLADAFSTRYIRRMLVGGSLKVVLASDHEPLFSLWQRFGIGTVFQPIDLINETLRTCFGVAQPRIAVCNLNPVTMSEGHFGDEELRVIEPAILMAREAGICVDGPLPAADIFAGSNGRRFDGVVAMYHDQGAVAVRMTAPNATVSSILGLPVIHVEPQIGQVFSAPGQGPAREEPFKAALRLAFEMARNRAAHQRLPAAPSPATGAEGTGGKGLS